MLKKHPPLIELILSEMTDNKGKISFARYMDLALYAPGLGYYTAGTKKFGKYGDFITAPEISPLFSRCIAKQCHAVLKALPEQNILELGAGTGKMAAEILSSLSTDESLSLHYFILEPSADLRSQQALTLQQTVPHLFSRVTWLNTLPSHFIGVILANEVADALPVHRFQFDGNILQEYYVTSNDDGFAWTLDTPSDLLLASHLQSSLPPLQTKYTSEICLMLPAWINSLSLALSQGLILIIDYGFPSHEYYHPDRTQGTLMCHFQHRAHGDPFFMPGLQDITAHVDFTAIAKSAVTAGLQVAGYTTQAHFLLGCDILSLIQQKEYDTKAWLQLTHSLKLLLLESEMGELFKTIALTKELDIPLVGFSYRDLRHHL